LRDSSSIPLFSFYTPKFICVSNFAPSNYTLNNLISLVYLFLGYWKSCLCNPNLSLFWHLRGCAEKTMACRKKPNIFLKTLSAKQHPGPWSDTWPNDVESTWASSSFFTLYFLKEKNCNNYLLVIYFNDKYVLEIYNLMLNWFYKNKI